MNYFIAKYLIMSQEGKIGIIGSGLIGRSWAMLFASAGFKVSLYDIVSENVDIALIDIKQQLNNLQEKGLLRGKINANQQFSLISKASSLADAVDNAIHIQECVFEDLNLKTKVFKQLDELASKDVVLCSSTSCILPSLFAETLSHRNQVIVGHPVNPPYFIPLVEIIPSKWTDDAVVKRTRALFAQIGQKPVTLKKEVLGFIVNRIQHSITSEAYRLIADDVVSVEDLEMAMTDGPGMRFAFIGPWETLQLNANGMEEYFAKYAKGIYDVVSDFGPNPKMEGEVASLITKEMNKRIPIEKLAERRKWRDERLIAFSQLKKKLDSENS